MVRVHVREGRGQERPATSQVRLILTAVVTGAVALLTIVPIALATEPVATTTTIDPLPAYAYPGDTVAVTVRVVPNPGGGTISLGYTNGFEVASGAFPVDPATGTVEASFVAVASPTDHIHVAAEFGGTDGYAGSTAQGDIPLRYPPNVVFTVVPPPATQDTDAPMEFLVGDGVKTECRLDAASYVPCESPVTLHGVTEGTHQFDVHAFAADGHSGQTGSVSWIVDRTAPVPGTVTLDGGAASSNQTTLELAAPATDALSGIASIRVSSTGETDSDGVLVLGGGAWPSAFDRPWADGPLIDWTPDRSAGSGVRTAYVQWTDAAGNHSPVVSDTIDLRIATIMLADGAWQTPTSQVDFALDGIDPAEVVSVLISNTDSFADGKLDEAIEFPSVPATWSLDDATAGGSSVRGSKVVYAQWKDANGRWSNVFGQAIADRPLIPVDAQFDEGSITAVPLVHLALVIGDLPGQGVNTSFAYSCDGTTWAFGSLAAPSQALALDQPAAGCPPTDGPRQIHVRWQLVDCCVSGAPASSERTVSITLDSTAPTAPSAPASRLTGPGQSLVANNAPIVIAWSAVSGMHYQVRTAVDGGPFGSATTLSPASLVRLVAPGHTYRFSVRSVDGSGAFGAWSNGGTIRVVGVAERSPLVHYHGTWASVTSSTIWWGGAARSSSTKGATVSYTFTGRSIAWIGLRAPTRGRAAVYVNGVYRATIDLYAATVRKQQVVWSANFSTSATRTVTIKVLGTTGRPRVDVDGFIVGS